LGAAPGVGAGDELRVLRLGLWVNSLLVAAKLAGGIWAGSISLVSDAFHSSADLITDLVAIWSVKLSSRPADERHPYGHGRAETLATLLCGSSLVGVAFLFVFLGLRDFLGFSLGSRLLEPPEPLAFWLALSSVVSKELLARYTILRSEALRNDLLKAKGLEHRSDALSSVVVVAGTGLSRLGGALVGLDGLAAAVVGLFIGWSALPLLLSSVHELMDGIPSGEEVERVKSLVGEVPGVMDFHKVRIRRLGPYASVDLHVLVDPSLDVVKAHEIASRVESTLGSYLGHRSTVVVHVEPFDPSSGGGIPSPGDPHAVGQPLEGGEVGPNGYEGEGQDHQRSLADDQAAQSQDDHPLGSLKEPSLALHPQGLGPGPDVAHHHRAGSSCEGEQQDGEAEGRSIPI